MKLKDKVAIITGGSKGIGFGCAKIFAKYGCKVVMGSRGQKDGEAAEKELTALGHTAMFIPCDVTSEKDMANLVDTTVSRFGRLDCMVNNAGWHPPASPIESISVEDFEKLLRLNLTSTFIGCKLAVPHLIKTRGNIINMSSEVALLGQPDAVAYCATKGGQISLTRALALDMAPKGVRINAVCPAGVLTPLMMEWANSLANPAEALKTQDLTHPLGRMATIEEMGEVCAFLASEEASFVTGQAIQPDGGAALGYRR